MGANVPISEVTWSNFRQRLSSIRHHGIDSTHENDKDGSYSQTCLAVRIIEGTRIETVRVGHVVEAAKGRPVYRSVRAAGDGGNAPLGRGGWLGGADSDS